MGLRLLIKFKLWKKKKKILTLDFIWTGFCSPGSGWYHSTQWRLPFHRTTNMAGHTATHSQRNCWKQTPVFFHKDRIVGSKKKTCGLKAFLQSSLSELTVDEADVGGTAPHLEDPRSPKSPKHSHTSTLRSEIDSLFSGLWIKAWLWAPTAVEHDAVLLPSAQRTLHVCSWPRGKKITLTLTRFCEEHFNSDFRFAAELVTTTTTTVHLKHARKDTEPDRGVTLKTSYWDYSWKWRSNLIPVSKMEQLTTPRVTKSNNTSAVMGSSTDQARKKKPNPPN